MNKNIKIAKQLIKIAKNLIAEEYKKWSDLTEQEQQDFSNEFYTYWKENKFGEPDINDSNNPYPWGCPWLYAKNYNVMSPKEYFNDIKRDIEEEIRRRKIFEKYK